MTRIKIDSNQAENERATTSTDDDSQTDTCTPIDGNSTADLSESGSQGNPENFVVVQEEHQQTYPAGFKLGHDESSHNSDAEFDDDENQYEEQFRQAALIALASLSESLRGQDFDLRPKFAILRHNSDLLNLAASEPNKRKPFPRTPSWFFNMPITRSPFPSFGSKLVDNADE